MKKSSPKNLRFVLGILVFTSSVSILSTDLYAPSLPHLPAYFNTSAAMVKLTMTFNVLVYALSQLVYGPLSDRFGRRPILIGGMIAFTLSCLLCSLAQSIEQLIAARIFQGVAGAAESVVIVAIIRDLFSGNDRVKALALFGIALGAAPAIGPLLGGLIHVSFGWRANFYLLTILAAAAFALIAKYVPESSQPDHHAVKASQVAKSYFKLLGNPLFISYALLVGSSLGCIFAFITAGPFIFINRFEVPTEQFGLYYFCIVACFMLGSAYANKVAHSRPIMNTLQLGVTLVSAGAVVLLIVFLYGADSPITITVAMCLILFGAGPIFAIGPAKALDVTNNRIGYASALLGCIELIVAGLAATLITVLNDDSSMPLTIAIVALATTTIGALMIVKQQEHKVSNMGNAA